MPGAWRPLAAGDADGVKLVGQPEQFPAQQGDGDVAVQPDRVVQRAQVEVGAAGAGGTGPGVSRIALTGSAWPLRL